MRASYFESLETLAHAGSKKKKTIKKYRHPIYALLVDGVHRVCNQRYYNQSIWSAEVNNQVSYDQYMNYVFPVFFA